MACKHGQPLKSRRSTPMFRRSQSHPDGSMPIYEYECNACGERHEFIQKFSEGPKRKCPSCGKSRLRKLMSAAAFHLKGDGWYVTDFRDKGKKKSGDAESASETKSGSSSDAKADAKTEKKEPAKTKKKGDAASAST